MSDKKNLVIGSGSGYSWYTFEPFVRSFLKNCPNTDLVLVVDNLSDFTSNYLKSLGNGAIKLVPFLSDTKSGLPVNERWKNFLNYLENHGDEYNQVLIADTRDIVFQGDVFENFADQTEYIGYTLEEDTIRGSKAGVIGNYDWLARCFGKEEADKLADKQIICEGTLIGTVNLMKIYIKKLLELMPDENFHGADQATEQYIIYNNLLPIENLIAIDNIHGAILTAYPALLLNPVQPKDNCILRCDGEVPAVVHQYDRFPNFIEFVDNIYREKTFQAQESFTDAVSAFEQIPNLIISDDVEQALKFFMNYVLNKKDLSGERDMLLTIWELLLRRRKITAESEMLELLLQHLLIQALQSNVNFLQIDKVYACVIKSRATNRTISTTFKVFMVNLLFVVVNNLFKADNMPLCQKYLDWMLSFDVQLNNNVYQLQAQIYNRLGRKKEAKQIMKKIFSN